MFTRQFGNAMLAPTAVGNPSPIAHSITWASQLIADHSVAVDASFAVIQILLGLGIAWRPTIRPALAATVMWSLGVWWFGEGLGGVVSGAANPINGAPGAVLIYAILAVLLWPVDRAGLNPPFTAARAVGERASRLIWVALWVSLAVFSVTGANRSSQGLHNLVGGLRAGEPRWLATLDQHVANVLAHRGLEFSIALAVVLAIIAVGVYLPWRLARMITVLAVAAGLGFWVVGENFGTVFSSSATDPNSGPLLVLFAAVYWRRRPEPSGPMAPIPNRELEGV